MKMIVNKKEIGTIWRVLKPYLILLICSIAYSFGTIFFLSQAQTVPMGISVIPQILSYFFSIKEFIYLIYLALNIPLIIIFYKKISQNFLMKTVFWLISNAIFGFILGYGVIYDSIFNVIKISDRNVSDIASNFDGLIYALLAILINGVAAGYTWKYGASTGGTDIVAYYFSTKKRKDVGSFLRLISILFSTIGIIIMFSLGKYHKLFGLQTIYSFLYIFLSSFIINFIFPKYKKVKIRIDSKRIDEIYSYLRRTDFKHSFSIVEFISGYLGTKSKAIESVVLGFEVENIKKNILELDKNAWISTSPIINIKGKFDYSFYDQDNKYGAIFITTTDTLIGIGAPISKRNLDLIYKLKKRSRSKKLSIAVANIEQLEKMEKLTDIDRQYIKKYWPGKTTLIINKTAYRMPGEENLLKLIETLGPIYLTSANISNQKCAESVEEARKIFPQIFKVYNFSVGTNVPSTIIKTKDGEIIR